jgi:hypothetical protein
MGAYLRPVSALEAEISRRRALVIKFFAGMIGNSAQRYLIVREGLNKSQSMMIDFGLAF